MWSILSNHEYLPLQWGAVVGASLLAAATDIKSRRISNRLTGALALSGLVFAGFVGGASGVIESLAACLLLAIPYVLLFVFANGGAGDAKLMGGIGAWLGLFQGGVTLAAVAMSGIVLAVAFAAAKGRVKAVFVNVMAMFTVGIGLLLARLPIAGAMATGGGDAGGTEQEIQRIPYGVAICTGVLVACGGLFLWRS